MGAPQFRTLLCLTGSRGSALLAADVAEGPALLAAFAALDEQRDAADVDDIPAKNRHGARRWELRDRAGQPIGHLYVEPTCAIDIRDPRWLVDGGYPTVSGWWRDTGGQPATLVL